MPSQRRIGKIISEVTEPKIKTEKDKILENREYRFKELLGEDTEDFMIERLAHSSIDPWDLHDLLKNGCDPAIALEILF